MVLGSTLHVNKGKVHINSATNYSICWCNSGAKAVEVTNQYLIILRPTPWDAAHTQQCLGGQEPEANRPGTLGGNPTPLFFNKMTLLTFCYTHSSVSWSVAQTSSEKIIPAIDRNKYRDVQRARDRGPLGPKWDVPINSLPSRFRESWERGGRGTLRGRWCGGHQGNKDFSAQQDWHTYALTENAKTAAGIGPVQVWTGQDSGSQSGSGHRPTPLTQESSPTDTTTNKRVREQELMWIWGRSWRGPRRSWRMRSHN